MRTSRRFLCGTAATLIVALTLQPAVAITNNSWEIVPSAPATSTGPSRAFFIYSLSPGQVLHDSVTIRNLTAQQLRFNLFASDAVNSPGNGAFGLQGPDATKVDISRWVSLPPSPVIVPSEAHVDLPFTVVVPADASPGDHTGGVVAAELRPSGQSGSGSARVNIVRALGVRVYARVAGQVRPGLGVSSLTIHRNLPIVPHLTGSGRAVVIYTVTNTGNIREEATARLHMTDVFGRTITNLPDMKVPELLPNGHVTVTEEWRRVPAVGRFTAHLELTTSDVRVVRAGRFWAIPWVVILVLAAILVLIVATVAFKRRRNLSEP